MESGTVGPFIFVFDLALWSQTYIMQLKWPKFFLKENLHVVTLLTIPLFSFSSQNGSCLNGDFYNF